MISILEQAANYLFWVYIIQGISFILLGILIAYNPLLLLLLVIIMFIWNGLLSFVIAWKIKAHAKDLPELNR